MPKKKLNANSNKLLYQQVAEFIVDRINNGVYKPNEAIPPERDLCKQLDVSRYTIRKAIKELVKEGYLYRVQGNGTFVFEKKDIHKGNSDFVGVILPSCDTEMEMKILKGIQQGLKSLNYKMTFVDSDNNYKKEAEHIHSLKNDGAAGLIIMPAEDQKDSTAISDLKSEDFPFVLVDRKLEDCETDCVMSDNINGSYTATEYLIKMGHERIAFVKHNFSNTSTVTARIIGYKKALMDYGLNFDYVFSFDKDKNLQKLYDFLRAEKPTALVSLNDYVALDIVKLCRRENIEIPAEISLISFDDLDIVKHLEVPLTTVAQHSRRIGLKAAEILVDKIKRYQQSETKLQDKEHFIQIYYQTKLIERESCLKLN